MAAKKKAAELTQAQLDALTPKKDERREMVYTIMVSGASDRVKLDSALRALEAQNVPRNLIRIDPGNGVISVPRMLVFWRGDATEHAWQAAIKAAIPHCLIDVTEWSHAPGYPQGDIGDTTNE